MNQIISYATFLLSAVAAIWIITSCAKRIIKVIRGSILGGIALYSVSHFFPAIAVGINAVTCLSCGILGFPGFIMLFILKILL
jgi:hypothetical protein